jgi:hypothetical protein
MLALATYWTLSRDSRCRLKHTGARPAVQGRIGPPCTFPNTKTTELGTHHDAAHTADAGPAASNSTSVAVAVIALAAAPIRRRGVFSRVAKRPQHVQHTLQPHGRVVVCQYEFRVSLVLGLQ